MTDAECSSVEIDGHVITYRQAGQGEAVLLRRSPMHVAEQLHAAIPGAELAIIPNAGHVSNMEQPEAFNRCIRRFCLQCDVA